MEYVLAQYFGNFYRKPMGSEEFLKRMVGTLGITIIDRCPKERPRKRES
jgi:hypothetical protein